MEKVTCKYRDWTKGQEEALLNILGEENARRLLSGELSVEFKEVIRKLFDKNGRRIPKDLSSSVCDPDKRFKLVQPRMKTVKDYARVLKILADALGVGVQDLGITAEEFKAKAEELMSTIPSNSANIKKGVGLPLVLPKFESFEKLLCSVNNSYKNVFQNRNFCYNLKSELGLSVVAAKTVEGSRQDQLIEKMKQGPVVIIFFPNSLQGFSVNASREQMESLPEGFILSGIETIIAMIMYPEVLARDSYTPTLGLAGLFRQSSDYSLLFWAADNELSFGDGVHSSHAIDDISSGLSFRG